MKVITFMHQKGGVGKSTLAYNMAVNLKSAGKVCILDVDYQGSLYDIRGHTEVDIYHISQLDEIKTLDYDLMFIDTPPYIFEGIEKVCALSDVIVVPMRAGIADLLSIKKTISLLIEYNCAEKSLIVLNMVKPKTTLTDEIRKEVEQYGLPFTNCNISDLVVFSRSLLLNGVEENKSAQMQIDQLTKEILTKAL